MQDWKKQGYKNDRTARKAVVPCTRGFWSRSCGFSSFAIWPSVIFLNFPSHPLRLVANPSETPPARPWRGEIIRACPRGTIHRKLHEAGYIYYADELCGPAWWDDSQRRGARSAATAQRSAVISVTVALCQCAPRGRAPLNVQYDYLHIRKRHWDDRRWVYVAVSRVSL